MKVSRALPVLSLLALCSAGSVACSKTPPAKAPTASATGPSAEPAGPTTSPSPLGLSDSPGVQTSGLNVSDDIAKLCNLPPTKPQPSFDFDSSTIADDDKDLLSALAKCLTEGPLKGKAVALIGRADPRGENEYNMGLGGARADAVRRYLKGLGIEEGRLSTTSRGELDAVGKDEAGWARDRRVDINLGKSAP